MKPTGYFKVALATTYNIILNALTLGRYVWLEGRVRQGVFKNWAKRFRYRPANFVQPTTESEIVELVKSSKRLRLFGSAHSFNGGVLVDDTLVSLDRYSGVIWKDPEKKQIAVKAGTRVRDVVAVLLDEGLAFAAQPSHDAQSMAGILSTDVHGTGRDWGFVSESVVSLKLVDGNGKIIECKPSDDLFKAAIGGIGAVGIITEVVVQGVDRFNVRQEVVIKDFSYVEENLDRLLQENEHCSLYLFPFTDRCQINTWNRTDKPHSFLGSIREFVSISIDALAAAWMGNFMAYTGLLPKFSSIAHSMKMGTNLVMESNEAFNRTIYHLHQELEFAVPFEETFEACRRFKALYEELYSEGLPYALFEVRFTPAGHDRTLIGAGRERRSTWIDLVCNDSEGFEKYYAAAENLIKSNAARPHLGKYCEGLDKSDLERMHQNSFSRFQQLMAEHDPEGKFANAFTRRMLAQDV
ncbi:MAG: FAD-binding protein [Deltaproteobacteria bacterium]|jgi:FAD/FMN-containing dehydrogenase|nr:FAD-binding protein [Deltaproteobacteria bacterium]